MAVNRGIDQATLDALGSGTVFPVSLFEVEWTDGNTYYFHTGFGNLVWNGNTWVPLAYLSDGQVFQIGKIELPDEDMSIASADANLKIAATIDALLKTQSEYGRGLFVRVFFGVVTEPSGNVLVGEPFNTFTGITSGNSFSHETPELNIQVTSGVPARASASIVHSTEDQIARGYTNDTLFDRLGVAQKWKSKGIKWPE